MLLALAAGFLLLLLLLLLCLGGVVERPRGLLAAAARPSKHLEIELLAVGTLKKVSAKLAETALRVTELEVENEKTPCLQSDFALELQAVYLAFGRVRVAQRGHVGAGAGRAQG